MEEGSEPEVPPASGGLRCSPKRTKKSPAPKGAEPGQGVLRTANVPEHPLTAGAPAYLMMMRPAGAAYCSPITPFSTVWV